jgi:hypothetical protein
LKVGEEVDGGPRRRAAVHQRQSTFSEGWIQHERDAEEGIEMAVLKELKPGKEEL